MAQKSSGERYEGFLCKSLEVYDDATIFHGKAKHSPTDVKFNPETTPERDQDGFWGFPNESCEGAVWLDSLKVHDRKMDFFEFESRSGDEKRNVLIRHDFGKQVRSPLGCGEQPHKDADDREGSPETEILVDIPLSPETQKKNELCTYLQLMNMKNADKKTVSAIQNRRSNRVKNLKIMTEKRNMDQKLLAEFKESLEKKSFEELGLVVKENYQITSTAEKINFTTESIPERLLKEVENFDDSIMRVIGTDIKKKMQNDHKNNNLKENKRYAKKINTIKKQTKSPENKSKMEKPKLILKKYNNGKLLRSSINLNDVGIKTLTLTERKFKSLRSAVNLNNVGIKSLTLNENKIKQIITRKRIESRKSFLLNNKMKIRHKENTRRINVKIKMNNERINNKSRISHRKENVRKTSVDSKLITRRQNITVQLPRKSLRPKKPAEKRREFERVNEKPVQNHDPKTIKNHDVKIVKDHESKPIKDQNKNQNDKFAKNLTKNQNDKPIKIEDVKSANVENAKVTITNQDCTVLNGQENKIETDTNLKKIENNEIYRATRNSKYVTVRKESDLKNTKQVEISDAKDETKNIENLQQEVVKTLKEDVKDIRNDPKIENKIDPNTKTNNSNIPKESKNTIDSFDQNEKVVIEKINCKDTVIPKKTEDIPIKDTINKKTNDIKLSPQKITKKEICTDSTTKIKEIVKHFDLEKIPSPKNHPDAQKKSDLRIISDIQLKSPDKTRKPIEIQKKLYPPNAQASPLIATRTTTRDCQKNIKTNLCNVLSSNSTDNVKDVQENRALQKNKAPSPRSTRSELSPRMQKIRQPTGLSPKRKRSPEVRCNLTSLYNKMNPELNKTSNMKNLKSDIQKIDMIEKKTPEEMPTHKNEKAKTIAVNNEAIGNETKKKVEMNEIKLGRFERGVCCYNNVTIPLKKRRISLLPPVCEKSIQNDLVKVTGKICTDTTDDVHTNKDLIPKNSFNQIEDKRDDLTNGKTNGNNVPKVVSPKRPLPLSDTKNLPDTNSHDNNSESPGSNSTAEISKCVFREDKTEMLNNLQTSFNIVDLSQSFYDNKYLVTYSNYNCWQEHNYTKKPQLDKFNKDLYLNDSTGSELSNDDKEFLKESYKEIPRINSIPPTDIFEPKTEAIPPEKPPKAHMKPTRNLHRLLVQKNRNSSDTVESLSNENCFDDRVSTNSVKVDFAKGKILNAYYAGYNLVIIQEQLVSFWTQSPLGNMLGVHNLWVSKGQVQRLPLDCNYICKESQQVVVNLENKSCAYIELWMKEHKSDKRELPLADVFATVYFWTSRNATELNKKLLQLANIKGNIKDVQYVVLRTARKIIVSWVETQNTPLTTIVSCYVLSPDFQTVVSVLRMTSVNHYVRSLHAMGDCCDAVVGFSENLITIWELEYGEVFETIEITQRYSNPRMLWLERDRGLLFFIQYHKLERLLMLIAVNGYSKESKKMQVFRIPTGYDALKGLCVDNNMLSAIFKNGIICWNMKTGDEIVAELSSLPYLIPSNKHVITIRSNTVEVTHFQSYFLTNFDLQL